MLVYSQKKTKTSLTREKVQNEQSERIRQSLLTVGDQDFDTQFLCRLL